MTFHFSALLLTGCLLAAPALAAETTYDRGIEFQYPQLLKEYIGRHAEALAAEEQTVDNFGQATMCREWRKDHNNEFDRPAMLEKVKAKLLEAKPSGINRYTVITEASFGQYEGAKAAFPFKLAEDENVELGFRVNQSTNSNFGQDPDVCLVAGGKWPAEFNVEITNPTVFDGIPMPVEAGRDFLAKHPARNILLALTFAVEDWSVASNNMSLLKGRIIDAAILDQADNNKVIYDFDDAYFNKPAKEETAPAAP